MQVTETKLPGVLILEPKVFADSRGYFLETWQQERYAALGIPAHMLQDNVSCSVRGVLRGLHFQNPRPQGKLVHVLAGEVFDVAVDIRLGSPTFGQWVGVTLSAENKRQFYVPEGFAHGFCVTSNEAVFAYKCTDVYFAAGDGSVLWNDPDLGIEWPITAPLLSPKDAAALPLHRIAAERLPKYPQPAAARQAA